MSGREIATTSGQQLLLPEATRRQRKERTVTVAVNSRDRNLATNFNSNSFRFRLRRPLKDILSIRLVNGSVPADLYNINTGWNTFQFREGATIWTVTLQPGQYDATQLAAELQTRLNALVGVTNTYAVAVSPTTKRVTITATGAPPAEFTFLFGTGVPVDQLDTYTGALQTINTPARLYGFEMFDYVSTGGVLTAPNRVDPDFLLQKVYLYINVDSGVELNRLEMGQGRHDCFTILYLGDKRSGYYYLNYDTYIAEYIAAPAPLARLSVLDIAIRDEFYRLVDLSQHDFTLVFEITHLD